MRRFVGLSVVALLGSATAGCAATAQGQAGVYADVTYEEPAVVVYQDTVTFREPPPLVEVEADFYVVENADVPIYYHSGVYWYVRGGPWYRASHWDEPWVSVSVSVVPTDVVHRDHRHYVRYQRPRSARVWREPPDRRSYSYDTSRPDRERPRLLRDEEYRTQKRQRPTPAARERDRPSVRREEPARPMPTPRAIDRDPSPPPKVDRDDVRAPAPRQIERDERPTPPPKVDRDDRPTPPPKKVERDDRPAPPPKADRDDRPAPPPKVDRDEPQPPKKVEKPKKNEPKKGKKDEPKGPKK